METNPFLNYWNLYLQFDRDNALTPNLQKSKAKIQTFLER